jgi:hypothetical protein
MATYPDNLANFTSVQDGVNTVQAVHVNVGYQEITATQTELGANASDRSGSWATTPMVVSSLTFTDVKSRLDNVENGAYYSQTSLVNKNGGTTILPATSGTKGLIIKGAASQSVNLLEFQVDGSTTAVSYFKNDGTFFTPIIDGGTA